MKILDEILKSSRTHSKVQKMKDYASEIQNILFIQSWIEWRRIHQLGIAANFNWIGSNH